MSTLIHHIDGKPVTITAAEAQAMTAGLSSGPAPGASALSPAQLAIMLMKAGVITPVEAEEFAASGAIPATMLTAINAALQSSGLSESDQAIVMIKLRGALEYRRTDPAVPIIGAAMGLDAAGLDALWEQGSAL